jgi:hypothetical protein
MTDWKKGRKLIEVICAGCGKNFEKTLSEFNRSEKNGKKHYCGVKCNLNRRIETHDENLKSCKHCGKKIIGETRSTFCSKSCAASYNNPSRKGEKKNFSAEGLKNILLSNKNYQSSLPALIEYNTNPNHCKQCNIDLPFIYRKRTYCSKDCRRVYDRDNMPKYQYYYKNCQFKFGLTDFPTEFDFKLIEEYGWYNAKNHGDNLNGVSRDHMISVKFGFENNISAEIISHPANCKLLRHNDNVSKHSKCSITLDDLMLKITEWNIKYN